MKERFYSSQLITTRDQVYQVIITPSTCSNVAFFLKIDREIFLRKEFNEDLEALLRHSRQDGLPIVLALDANVFMDIGNLARMFKSIPLQLHM